MTLDKYEAIILDCDGVIFDSNNLKLNAFRNILSNYNEDIVNKFIEYFKNNFGTSRYHLAKVFIEEFLKQEFNEELYQKILDSYSKKCVLLYEKADITINFFEFIDKYKDKNLFVASGSAEDELRRMFEIRKLDNYFVEIFGSPTKKTEIVKNIVKENKNTVMIGDAKSDMLAAKENNIDFIFMSEYSTNEEMINDKNLCIVNNLGCLM
jgi:HAD superfamily hydrolase (TIGR01549 family)